MSIEGIFLAQSASMPMQYMEQGRLIANQGLEGDRYCHQKGTYSVFRSSKLCPGTREPGRQLTLISADSIEEAFKEKLTEKLPSIGNLRRNIVVRGISAQELLQAQGQVVRLGKDSKILIQRHTVPCMYNERKNKIPGMMEAVWMEAGVSCQVLEGGDIKVGDDVEISLQKGTLDDGVQLPGYYVPPSKRTAAMVKEAMKLQREAKVELEAIDMEGVQRAAASYGTAGLKFWK